MPTRQLPPAGPARPDVLDAEDSPDGLTSAQAAGRLARWGPNVVVTRKPVGVARRAGKQLRDPLILVLLLAVGLTLVTRDIADAVIIALVVVVNTTVGVVQEVRADRAMTALRTLSDPRARVIRDGREQVVASADLVPGDLVVLSEGDLVPADGRLIEAAALLVDESSLTGESVPVDKSAPEPAGSGEPADPSPGGFPAGVPRGGVPADDRPGGLSADALPGGFSADRSLGGVPTDARFGAGLTPGQDQTVSAGTVVVRGRGRFLVTATGPRSSTGRLAALLDVDAPATPLQNRLRGLSRLLAGAVVALSAGVGALGLVRGQPWELMVVTAISLAVAAVPESLPAVVTLSLALGARRMAARHAIVRELHAVETLGSVSVIATDKTGTLTEGRMVAQRLWTPAGEAELSGAGWAGHGSVVRDGAPVGPESAPDLADLLRAAVLCSDATLVRTDGPEGVQALGDPTEVALLVAAGNLGLDVTAVRAGTPRISEFPFDSRRKRMSTVHRVGNDIEVICKGAPELVLPLLVGGTPADASAAAHRFAAEGLRVLAVTTARRHRVPSRADEAEAAQTFLGLIAIADPPRESATPTIASIRRAGIVPLLITGDHRATAFAVARAVGIADTADQVRDAGDLGLTDADAVRGVSVIARATPEDKVAVVEAHRRAGDVVAMTGDGVNDGPALRHADIGVAMGKRGTEVARQAADLVLADDQLATLVAAVEEGRRIYGNIRRFLLYAMAGGLAEIVVMVAGPFLGLALPLLPAQILWVNLLTHGLVGVALGAEPSEPGAMRRPPRPPTQSVLGAGLWKRIGRLGFLIALVTTAVAIWAEQTGRPWQTMAFVTLGMGQLGIALALRARPVGWANPFLLGAVAVAATLQVLPVYVPLLQGLLGTAPLAPLDLLVAMGAGVVGYLGVLLDRRLHPRA